MLEYFEDSRIMNVEFKSALYPDSELQNIEYRIKVN